MIAAIKSAGSNTRGLLAYLYGPGRHDEHLDPHIVAGFAMLGLPDPGRDENATLTELARYLDETVRLRNSEFGQKVTDHVWHCPVRAAPEDRYLSDVEWDEIAQRIVQAAGIAPADDDLACRWIAVRHADDHIHILATTVREDGRRPKLHDSGLRVGDACREIEKDYGLRRLKKGDRTGARRPTQAEMHKAKRLGWEQPSREWLQDRIRAAMPHVTNAEEFIAYLEADDIEVKARRGPSGDLLGYAVGRPGDLSEKGEQIFHSGGKIAPDLSLPKIKARLESSRPAEHPTARRNSPSTPWHQATDALDALHADLADDTQRPSPHHCPRRTTGSHRAESPGHFARRTPGSLQGVRPSPALPNPGRGPRRPGTAQRGARHRPHRHRPRRKRAGRPGRRTRLGDHRRCTLARSEEPRPPGRRRRPGRPAPPDGRRPRPCPGTRRPDSQAAQGSSPSRSRERRTSSHPRPRRAHPHRPGLAGARHRPCRRRSPWPSTPPASQGGCCPARVDHRPPTRPRADHPHPAHRPEPGAQPSCRGCPHAVDHGGLDPGPADPK